MNSVFKLTLLSCSVVIPCAGLLFAGGVLSTPRDFASPATSIRVLDGSGAPLSGIAVTRTWNDYDTGEGSQDAAVTGQTGRAQFPKISASVGLSTGALRKLVGFFGRCGSSSGTQTTISVSYSGRYFVAPRGKPLHPYGRIQLDPDGVRFEVGANSRSNTWVELTFPPSTKTIDYTLLSRPRLE
jgi:hypothetical protein